MSVKSFMVQAPSVKSTTSYYNTELITAVKRFMRQAPRLCRKLGGCD